MPTYAQKLAPPSREAFSRLAKSISAAPRSATRRMPVQRCACGGTCPECRRKHAQADQALRTLLWRAPGTSGSGGAAASPFISEESHPAGQPLEGDDRALMESRFGHDFSRVRVHTDAVANRSADSVGARAYTTGNQIVFGSGQHSPGTRAGQALLAHELVHTIQQRGSSGLAHPTITPDSHPAEAEARSVSDAVMDGGTAPPVQPAVALGRQSVSMQLDPKKIYCALHAAVCLGLSENPPAAALCWANFAARCAGAMASAEQAGGGEAVAGAAGGAGGATEGMPTEAMA